jgi:2-polyprenyl-3-methyl-5-hydroxy-6-metoxy-1,4-benzoquinol methylase/tetratricopeptide (TPR) repeat protein
MNKLDLGSFQPAELDLNALALSDRLSALSLNDIGLMEARDGHHSRAIMYFHKAIRKSPEHAFIFSNYALSLRDLGYFADAMRLLEHAITLDKKNATLFFNLANLQYETGSLSAALASYDRAVRLNGSFPDLYSNYGLAALEAQEYALALRLAQRGIEIAERQDPNYVRLSGILAILDVVLGDTKGALARLEAVLEHDQSAVTLFEYTRILGVAEPQDLTPNSFKYIGKELEERWSAPEEFVLSAWLFLVQLFGFPSYHRQHEWSRLGCQLLSAALIPDLKTESWLTEQREMLFAIDDGDVLDPSKIQHFCAIAQQCFLRNYLFEKNSLHERKRILWKSQIEARLVENEDIPVLWLIRLACLMPLAQLANCEHLLISTKDDQCFVALIKQQVENPLRERQFEKTIKRVTNCKDQKDCIIERYSEYPYPQWSWPGRLYRPERFNIYLAQRLGHSRFSQLKAASLTRILVAGCGTGRHSHLLARSVSDAEIKAVDVSRPSLAFAKRQASDDGVRNIDYLEADITTLHEWRQRFEVIECAGVLHHLSDPGLGLQGLISLLQPKGLIMLGLYSRRARQNIMALRQECERNFTASTNSQADDLEQRLHFSRKWVMENPEYQGILRFRDFYSQNECLDLLLNPREFLFTPLEIKNLLQRFNLIFRGFELSAGQRARFRMRYRGENDLFDLALWDEFEEENPEIFMGMYQFWAELKS